MRQFAYLAVILSLGLGLPSQGAAAQAQKAPATAAKPAGSAKPLPAPIAAMVAHNSVVIDHFQVPGGLTAWLMEAAGDKRVFYSTPDGQYVLLGLLFDETLNNVTAKHLARFPVATSPSAASPAAAATVQAQAAPSEILSRARRVETFVEGAGRDLYVIFDPACPYCHQLWRETRNLTSKLRIHWIPVAVLQPIANSSGMVETILASTRRDKALAAMASKTLAVAPVTSPKTQSAIGAAQIILALAGSTGVPLLIYEERGQTRTLVGLPERAVLENIAAGKGA